MALADLTALRAAQLSPTQESYVVKNATAKAVTWNSTFVASGSPATGVAPTTGAIPDRTTTGAFGQKNKSGTEQRAWLRKMMLGLTGGAGQSTIMLVDRLAHMGGLSGTSIAAQTVSTPALTRYTSGVGVIAAVECYTGTGANSTTITGSYDGDAGNGHTFQATVIPSTMLSPQVIPLSVQAGDQGVKTVSTVTLAASTLTVGNFGITLYKPLCWWSGSLNVPYMSSGDPIKYAGSMPVISDDACLQFLILNERATTMTLMADLAFFED